MLALYIIGGLALLGVAILAVPVELVFSFTIGEATTGRFRLGWFFGQLWLEPGRGKVKKPRKSRPKKKTGFRENLRRSLALLQTRGLMTGFLRLIRRTVGAFRVRRLAARLTIGLDDPAETGFLCALLWPALTPLTTAPRAAFQLEPVFLEPALAADGQGWLRVFPIEVIWYLLLFVLSPAGLRALRLVVREWR